MIEDIEHYKVIKFVYSLLFDGRDRDYSKEEWITDVNLFKYIFITTDSLSSYGFLSNKLKERIYEILSASRSIKNENFDERVLIINKIIMSINLQKKDNTDQYYRQELCKRAGKEKYMSPKYNIDGAIDDIEASIAYDHYILSTHNEEFVPLDTFKDEYIPEFSNAANYYFSSINAILSECPELFKDDDFKDRVYMVLQEIDKVYKTHKTKKVTKQFRKEISDKIN